MKYFILFICCMALGAGSAVAQGKKSYGLSERFIIPAISSGPVEAKMDTGAETSSLGATNIELFKKDGGDWVRFTPQVKGAKKVEMPIARHSRIKRRADGTGNTESIRRPVVMLEVCFDGKKHNIEVNLADRSRFAYPLLIGSNAMIGFGVLIDPALNNQASVSCP